MNFYIMRHGQTYFNVVERMQGWCDSPLTDQGIQQAKQAGKLLKDIDFEYAYSSTSERARDTLHYILEGRDIPIKALKGLREIHFGQMEGELEEYVFQILKIQYEDMPEYGGETKEMALKRFKKTLLDLSFQHNGNVLIVCHGGIMNSLLKELDPALMEWRRNQFKKPFPNGTGMEVECDGISFKLIRIVE